MKEIKMLIEKEIARINYYIKSNEERQNNKRAKELKSDITKLEKMLTCF